MLEFLDFPKFADESFIVIRSYTFWMCSVEILFFEIKWKGVLQNIFTKKPFFSDSTDFRRSQIVDCIQIVLVTDIFSNRKYIFEKLLASDSVNN